jgi:hypothetical protein
MTTAKRLGDTVFSNPDPLDDLRPSKQRKVFAVEGVKSSPASEPRPVIDLVPPSANPLPDEDPAIVADAEPDVREMTSVTVDAPKPKVKAREFEAQPTEDLRGKMRFSANVSLALKQRVENAAYWIPGMTISAITEVALERELRRLEKEFNAGRPFEKAGRLRYGRPRAED